MAVSCRRSRPLTRATRTSRPLVQIRPARSRAGGPRRQRRVSADVPRTRQAAEHHRDHGRQHQRRSRRTTSAVTTPSQNRTSSAKARPPRAGLQRLELQGARPPRPPDHRAAREPPRTAQRLRPGRHHAQPATPQAAVCRATDQDRRQACAVRPVGCLRPPAAPGADRRRTTSATPWPDASLDEGAGGRYWMSPAARAGAPAPSPASCAPIAARRGSGDRRLSSRAAATTPNGRVRSKG